MCRACAQLHQGLGGQAMCVPGGVMVTAGVLCAEGSLVPARPHACVLHLPPHRTHVKCSVGRTLGISGLPLLQGQRPGLRVHLSSGTSSYDDHGPVSRLPEEIAQTLGIQD